MAVKSGPNNTLVQRGLSRPSLDKNCSSGPDQHPTRKLNKAPRKRLNRHPSPPDRRDKDQGDSKQPPSTRHKKSRRSDHRKHHPPQHFTATRISDGHRVETVDWCEDSAHLAVARVLHDYGYRATGDDHDPNSQFSLAVAMVDQPCPPSGTDKNNQMAKPRRRKPCKWNPTSSAE